MAQSIPTIARKNVEKWRVSRAVSVDIIMTTATLTHTC